MNLTDLIPKVRRVLRDIRGKYWSDEEITEYLVDGQEDFVRYTHCLRGEFPITSKENQTVYNLPDDCMEVIRLQNSEGTVLTPATSEELDRTKGPGWETATGTPSAFFSDLDGAGQFRFYPRPVPSDEIGAIQNTRYSLSHFSLPPYTGTLSDMKKANGKVYILIRGSSTSKFFIYDASTMILINTLDVSGVLYAFTVTNNDVSIFDENVNRGIYATDRNKIYFIDENTGDSSTYGTLASTLMFPMMSSCNFYKSDSFIVYSYAWHDAYLVKTTSFGTPVNLISTGQYYDIVAGQNFWMGNSVDGFVKVDHLGSTTVISTGLSYAGSMSMYDIFGTSEKVLVVNHSTTEIEIYDDTAGTFTKTGIPIYSSTAGFFYDIDSSSLFVRNSSTEIYKYESLTKTDEIFFSNTTNVNHPYITVVCDVNLFFLSGGDVIYLKYASIADKDLGVITSLNGSDLNLDGALVDYSDTDKRLVNFDSEYGEVVAVYQSQDVATAWYVRKPSSEVVDIDDVQALIYYALYRAYEKDENRQNLSKAAYFNALYMRRVSRAKARAIRGFNKTRVSTRGYYY